MARRKGPFFGVTGALLLLSACAAQPGLQTSPPAPGRAMQPVLRPVAPVPAAMTMPSIPPVAKLEAPRVELPPPTDAPSLRARYGEPDFTRREMDSELWRYDAENCAIFFFLYREGAALKLRYSETLPRGMTMAADPACVERLNGREGSAP